MVTKVEFGMITFYQLFIDCTLDTLVIGGDFVQIDHISGIYWLYLTYHGDCC